eukprot:SM000113S24086  [mRNA]  locus=s113:425046:426398:+ [translate_table: standard]
MDGFPQQADREAIFRAYIGALKEDPDQYRRDTQALEEWAGQQTGDSIAGFASRDGSIENQLKNIAERAKSRKFHYSRLFAIGLFRALEVAKSADPSTLEKLCEALHISKQAVDRDLDVYRNLLSKLSIAKDLLKEFLAREAKKKVERDAEQASASAKETAKAE